MFSILKVVFSSREKKGIPMTLPLSASSALSPAPGLASRRTLLLVSALATLAGLAAIVADLALEYTSQQSALFSPTYQYLSDISEWRLLLGHFLGIAAITLEISGFWVVSQLARASGVRSARAMLLIVAAGTVVGIVFHGSVALTALLVQAQQAAPADAAPLLAATVAQVSAFTSPLIVVGLVSLAAWSVWYAVIVARGWTPLARGLALCNPLVIALICRIASVLVPPLGLILAPTALNVSTTATFLAVTLSLWWRRGSAVAAQSVERAA
jgi:uncharacterized protein DUF6796